MPTLPQLFKKGSVSAQRVLISAKADQHDNFEELCRQFSKKTWQTDEDITEKSVLLDAALRAQVLEADFEKYWNLKGSDEVKGQLKANTNEAFESGCFGCPWFLVEADGQSHSLFGSDRIELMCTMLGEEYQGPLPQHSKC